MGKPKGPKVSFGQVRSWLSFCHSGNDGSTWTRNPCTLPSGRRPVSMRTRCYNQASSKAPSQLAPPSSGYSAMLLVLMDWSWLMASGQGPTLTGIEPQQVKAQKGAFLCKARALGPSCLCTLSRRPMLQICSPGARGRRATAYKPHDQPVK